MATTGVAPTPALATAPAVALAPALAARPSVAPSPGPGTPGSVTSKEWVIPPRPKPGRKPATDTPPTKRKAQNRAAQRAFRERRAARVQELEEQIKEIEDGHDIRVAGLSEQINNLSQEVEQCREEMGWWRDRCHSLEKEVSIERSAKEALVKEFRTSFSPSNSNKSTAIPDSVPLPPRTRPSTRSSRMEGVVPTSTDRNKEDDQQNVPLGCNDCSQTHCQCIEDAFGTPIDTHESSRARHPPHGVGSPEREHAEPDIKPDPEEMEIDFTSRFAAVPAQPTTHTHNHNDSEASSPPVDPCGFCQDGTPCICAEMAAQEQQQQRGRRNSFENPRLAPIQSISQFTPPPSDGDVRSEVTLPPISEATNPSPFFARRWQPPGQRAELHREEAAAVAREPAEDAACLEMPPPPRPRVTTPPMSAAPPPAKPSTPNALTLSCADAFTTLSRHPNFSRASDEISAWLPKLHTLPNPQELALAESRGSRAAMEVEAASVMGVLRYFDRRFAEK
ncbi:uncharacterized protein N7469_002722 [Penicillium citrinum]|uniref:BZIP domain-containing protein n=1 Tax=Penicillium citrinum TaxID=5077 RepID=A0A9W9TTS8_PENCI|nr:uncharacterized protein N7469_002722 [Penicillium citrinum]KAJ5241131.1 hypothetical protein N7469_002722 [Penicillium citrinum]